MGKKKFYIESLGCPRNEVDSEIFAGLTELAGYKQTSSPEEADLIIINTCGFIADAKQESIETILELVGIKEEYPNIKIVVTGCLVKRYEKELKKEMPEVDYFVPLKDFKGFARWLSLKAETADRKNIYGFGHRYLRISDGCNNHCTYCAIPSIRGNVVSEKIETLIADARKLAEQGTKELVITAMDVTQYGTDLNDKNALIKLLSELIKIEGFKWIRLLYLHPAHITDELICFIKGNPIIVPYFDVPIQHINDEILARMNRKMRREDIETVITKIRHLIPEAVLRTTLMTAFPGETEEQHKELMDFVRKTKFDRLGVFIYSKEEGTPAYAYTPSVNHRRALRRQRELMELHSDISEGLLKRFIGQELDVIVDGTYPQNIYTIEGRTKFDAPDVDGTVLIQTDKYKQYKPGDFIRARIIESREHDLVAELVEKNL